MRKDKPPPEGANDRGAGSLPFPDTGYSPALQRTLKEKFDKGNIGGMDKAEFLKQLGKTVEQQPSEES